MPDAQLLHIGVARHFDMVNKGTTKRGTVLTKDTNRCHDSLLLIVGQARKPAIVLRCRTHSPRHAV
jgi:hypothetical protein